MKFVSTEKQLVSVTALRVEESMNETVSTNGTIHDNICKQRVRTFDPNYVKVTLLMDAAECNSPAGGGAIGRKLLELRSNKQMKNVSLGEIVSMGKQAEREWMELKALTLTRTHNYHSNSRGNGRKKPTRTKTKQQMKKKNKRIRRPGQMLPAKRRKSTRQKPMNDCAKSNDRVKSGFPSKRKLEVDPPVYASAKKRPRRGEVSVITPSPSTSAKKKVSL